MDLVPMFVDAMKTSMRRRVAAGHMVTVIGKLFARRDSWRFADNLVAFDHQPRAVGVQHDPFAAKQGHRAIGGIVDRDEIHERMGLVRWQTRPAVVIAQLVEGSREAGQFARAGHDKKESPD